LRSTREGTPVAREGYAFIAAGAVLTFLSWLAGWGLLALLFLLVTGWVVWFFRNPPRLVPRGEGLVVAPADGRVVRVLEPRDGEPAVGIFMNVLDVHVNRLPVSGEVTEVAYTPGTFVNASLDKASQDNERNRVTMRTPTGHEVTFVQVAGLVARRIVCWVKAGARGRAGDIFGLIRFGSRVDVHLPTGSDVWVVPGQRVSAGETILGKLPGGRHE
jgi:phosphatidylserine decarboxylase